MQGQRQIQVQREKLHRQRERATGAECQPEM
jgi:hypothetical protein